MKEKVIRRAKTTSKSNLVGLLTRILLKVNSRRIPNKRALKTLKRRIPKI